MAVGIKDVAKAAGVSPATVSRALGNGPVSEEVRALVEAAVRSTGYRPNLAARRLRSQQSGTVGLVVADIRNPFFTAVSRAVEDSAYRAGMRVILCNTDEDPEREAMYLRLMQEERISGMIFAPARTTLNPLPDGLDFPVVLIDRTLPHAQHDCVVLANRDAMSTLVDHLVERGYTHIGGLFGKASSTGDERRDGYLAAARKHKIEPEVRRVAPTPEAAFEAIRAWLDERKRPQAFVISNSLLLIGAVRAAREAKLSIPRDIALAGFDNEIWTELVSPGITVIEQPVEEIGRAAMSLLLERLKQPALPARRLVLNGRCIVRGSTARRTK